MVSVVVLGVGTGYVFTTRVWVEHQARAQAQQSLRAAVGAITRELRMSGACMGIGWVDQSEAPALNFRMLSGTSGPPDSLTRTANPRCAGPVKLTAPCNGCSTITVDNTLNFVPGMRAFIGQGPISTSGEYFLVQSVTATTVTVDPSTPLLQSYVTGGDPPAFVAGADQRTFAISSTCTGCNGIPTLTLQQLGDSQGQALVKGIDAMTIRYVLNRRYVDNPGLCNAQTGGTNSLCVVTLPGLAPSVSGDWKLVRALIFTLGARSVLSVRASGSADGFYHLSESVEISPRNFIFSPNTPRVQWTPY